MSIVIYLVWWFATRYIMFYAAGYIDKKTPGSQHSAPLAFLALVPWIGDIWFLFMVAGLLLYWIAIFFSRVYDAARW